MVRCALLAFSVALSASRAPFEPVHLTQPVLGAARGLSPEGWRAGKLCNCANSPYNAKGDNSSDDTAAIQHAIDDCGDLVEGGTVLLPKGGIFVSGSLWLKSNLTFRVEEGAMLIGSANWSAYPLTYTRSGCTMMPAHASLLNAGRCLKMKDPLVGWDDCESWSRLENIVIEGGGTINGNGDQWWTQCLPKCPDGTDTTQRPTLFGLLWVNGLTLRDVLIRRPAFWTIHPTFSNNVRISGVDVWTNGHGTDGLDIDSCWNVYITNSSFHTRDDCIALKSGKDWSGRLVNISTENVLIDASTFTGGHGVAMGSETSGWVRDVVFRDSVVSGVETVVRMKSMRGRGGGIERILYERITGNVEQPIQMTLSYKKSKKTNVTATPVIRNITIRDIAVNASGSAILCNGLEDSVITELTVENVTIANRTGEECSYCKGHQDEPSVNPKLCIAPSYV